MYGLFGAPESLIVAASVFSKNGTGHRPLFHFSVKEQVFTNIGRGWPGAATLSLASRKCCKICPCAPPRPGAALLERGLALPVEEIGQVLGHLVGEHGGSFLQKRFHAFAHIGGAAP